MRVATEHDRIAVEAVLKLHSLPRIRALQCKLVGGNLVVTGVLSSFYEQQLAQAALLPFGLPMEFQVKIDYKPANKN